MKDDFIGGIFLLGGIGVLISYMMLYVSGSLKRMLKVFTPNIFRIWVVSMLITTAAVLYLYYYFTFEKEIKGWSRNLIVASTILFLVSAMLWSVTIRYGEVSTKYRDLEIFPLYLTALGTIGILIGTVYATNNWIVIAAASIIVLHHLVIDAVVWKNLHSKTKLKTV